MKRPNLRNIGDLEELAKEGPRVPMPPMIMRKKFTRVKCFTGTRPGDLETCINDWLNKQDPTFRLVDIKFNHVNGGEVYAYSVLILYEFSAVCTKEEAQNNG